ncbi:Integrase [Solimonas aquatica]|uniref:Integrase n=2 Tax=Solimonas aquatica TaxID=489703 RepID=A0A1H9HHD4_9GAMM|nr:Integrase [Solimonas aquatica]
MGASQNPMGATVPLTEIQVRTAKPQEKAKRLFDGGGLYLEVSPAGGRWWRLKYRFEGKEKRLSLGVYPEVSLKDARSRRDEARKLIAAGIDPSADRQADRARKAEAGANSFEALAREWIERQATKWTQDYRDTILRRLERNVFPWLGVRPVADIKAPEVLATLRRIEARGAVETAHRANQVCSAVFRYAVATGRAESDPTTSLKGALPPWRKEHHASITEPKAVGELLRAIYGYQGTFTTACALKLAPLLFVRPGELRRAEWAEFDLDGAEWRIPAEKMKMRAPHIVPLSAQAVAILRELQRLTGKARYLFPGERSRHRPMSENTVNAALRRLGYSSEQMTGHGFRSMASTLLNEQGWHRDAIERQLAHGERNSVRAAYNYAEHLPERRKMMQSWADYLDALREDRKVLAGNFGRAA